MRVAYKRSTVKPLASAHLANPSRPDDFLKYTQCETGRRMTSEGKGQASRSRRRGAGGRLGRRSRHLPRSSPSATPSSTCARSRTCGRAPTPSARSPACATRSRRRAPLLPRARLLLDPHADHHGQRLRGRRADVPRVARSTWRTCRGRPEGGQDRLRAGLLRPRGHLTVSGQLNVETYCLALSRVYTFGPTFRAENSNTAGTWPSSG
jgi:hypothetical protein